MTYKNLNYYTSNNIYKNIAYSNNNNNNNNNLKALAVKNSD